jgi:hypothetical protein
MKHITATFRNDLHNSTVTIQPRVDGNTVYINRRQYKKLLTLCGIPGFRCSVPGSFHPIIMRGPVKDYLYESQHDLPTFAGLFC